MSPVRSSLGARLGEVLEHRYFVPLCLLTGLVLRLAWMFLLPALPASDFKWYFDRAAGIVHGLGYVDNGYPTATRPVGYAAFLGLAFLLPGSPLITAKLLGVMLQGCAMLLTYQVARAVLESRRAAAAAMLIVACYPNQIAYTAILASENLFLPLLLLGSLLMIQGLRGDRALRVVAGGVVFGAAALVRQQAIILPVLLLLVFLREARPVRRKAVLAVAALLAMAVVIAPWTARNLRTFPGLTLVAHNAGYNFLYYNGDQAEIQTVLHSTMDEYHKDHLAMQLGLAHVRRHPVEFVLRAPARFWGCYSYDYEGIRWTVVCLERASATVLRLFNPLKALAQLAYLALWLAFAGGLIRSATRPRPRYFFLGLVMLAYFVGINTVFGGGPRLHFQDIPWMALYAGAFIDWTLPAPRRATCVS